MGCWQKLAEIWTGTVHDPMNLLDNAIVGSVFVIIEQTSARRRPQRFFYSIGNTELRLNAKAMIPIEQDSILFAQTSKGSVKKHTFRRKSNMTTKKWELKDIIMMAILGVVFSAVYLAVFDGGVVLSTVLAPTGFSNFSFEIIYGVWFMAATLAAYIIRKPGVALVTEVLASAVELLMGNSGGVTVVLTGMIQGAGAELAFALFRYKKWDLASMSLASVFSASFIFCYELYYLNYIALAPGLLIAQLAVRFVSAIVFSGVICKLAGDGLAKTGVVKSYAIGAKAKIGRVYDEED